MSAGAGLPARVASDVVVVGGGVAGLVCALELAPLRVTLLTRRPLGEGGNTAWAQGGLAAALGATDSPERHWRDTLDAGAGLCDPAAVDWLVREAPEAIRYLLALGTPFDRAADGRLLLGREAAHGEARIVHARGDATGAALLGTLVARVRHAGHVCIDERARGVDLLQVDGRVCGILAVSPDGTRVVHEAPAVVLATGGIGRAYRHTTNPPEATGDGIVMAARAGAVLSDLEFVQFHPTALDVEGDPHPLITEALRGQGAHLVDETGRRFLLEVHPAGELAPRDVVSRAIWAHQAAGHRVWLDARATVGDGLPARFPTVFEACRRHGIDPRTDLVPVTPAAHYHMGGIAVDARGRTSLAGLWACGEVACTGVHGANRLASNSLVEGVVLGRRVARDVLASRRAPGPSSPSVGSAVHGVTEPPAASLAAGDEGAEEDVAALVRDVMWRYVGLVRSEHGLREALSRLREIPARAHSLDARNLALVGRLIATAALARTESRGAHFREDHPASSAHWCRRLLVVLRRDGEIVTATRPVGEHASSLEGVA